MEPTCPRGAARRGGDVAQSPCPRSGPQLNTSGARSPHCGAANALDDELARIDQAIADMKLRDMAIVQERTQLASRMEAAWYKRDILADANRERAKRASGRARPVRRRRPMGTMPPGEPP